MHLYKRTCVTIIGMKRFWCTIIFSLAILLSTGTFLIPEQAFAQTQAIEARAATPADPYEKYVQAKTYLVNAISPPNVTYYNTYSDSQKKEYTTQVIASLKGIADSRIQDLKNQKNATRDESALMTDILNDFERYLKNVKIDQTLTSDPFYVVYTQALAKSDALRGDISANRFTDGFYTAQSGGVGVVNTQSATQNATQQQNKTANQGDDSTKKCSNIIIAPFLECIDVFVSWIIKSTLLNIAGFLLWLSANMLNYVIQVGILQFSQWAPETLYPLWVVVRQVLSIVIFFMGMYLAFWYILNKDEKFTNYIPWVILFGLFVNFSYPLTRALIDVSNIIALNFYSSAVGPQALATTGQAAGDIIASKMGLSSLVASATDVDTNIGKAAVNSLKSIDSVPGALLAVAFVGYSAWVFFVATGIILARTVVLVFIIVASPLLFVDSVVPGLGDLASKLRKMFISQLAVAPLFMIMLALTMKFLDVFKASGVSVAGIAGGSTTVGIFVNLVFMLVCLNIMNKVTKMVSGEAGEFANKWIGQVGGFALGAGTMGAGLIGRSTIGNMAARARDGGWVQANQHTFLGGAVHKMTNSLATSSFDARNNSFIKTNTSALGLHMGMGSQSSFDKSTKDRAARRNEMRKKLNDMKEDEDVIDPNTGKIIRRKGQLTLAAENSLKEMKDQDRGTGSGLTGALNKATKKITYQSKEETKQIDKAVKGDIKSQGEEMFKNAKIDPETGRERTRAQRESYLSGLKDQLNEAKKTDPTLSNINSQALISGIKKIEDDKVHQEEVFAKSVEDTVRAYGAETDQAMRKKMLASINNDEVRQAVTARVQNVPSADPLSRMSSFMTPPAPAAAAQPQAQLQPTREPTREQQPLQQRMDSPDFGRRLPQVPERDASQPSLQEKMDSPTFGQRAPQPQATTNSVQERVDSTDYSKPAFERAGRSAPQFTSVQDLHQAPIRSSRRAQTAQPATKAPTVVIAEQKPTTTSPSTQTAPSNPNSIPA